MSSFAFRAAGLACVALIWAAGAVRAEPVQLKLATFGPPNSYFYVEVLIPWLEAVNRDSNGAVNIKYYGGGVLGNAGNMYDAVLTGAADIGWALPGTVPGKFVKTSVAELPFGYDSGEIGATALWRLFAKGVIASDFSDVKLFGLTAWPGADIQTKSKKVERLEDLKGLKIRAQGRWQTATVTAFGATPVYVPIDEVYQGLDRGVIDGVWGSLVLTREFRVDEIAHYFLEAPLNGGSGMLIMKRESYDKLPAAAKAAMEKNSGEAMSRALGKSNDGEVKRVEALLADLAKKGKIDAPYTLTPDEFARWRKAAEPVEEAWTKGVPDGAAILAAFRAEAASVKSGAGQ
ncbi:MAG TPA: TRAP transporter substrate-binding protein [Stellaceae bacterium]|nr:TRAP transporter substrate-binding protein [Stellaceae bacterium]